ncbi:hypothetical protein ADUPG1_002584, partial [Aduncisulcus paluster]
MKPGATPVLLGRDFIEDTHWLQGNAVHEVIKDVEEEELKFGDTCDKEPQVGEDPVLREELQRVLSDFKKDQDSTELCRAQEVRIELKDPNAVIYAVPRKLSPKKRMILEELVKELLGKGFIRPSSSPYASPVVIVPKKNNQYRLCVDFRKLNEEIIPIRYPLPRIDDLLSHLVGAEYFTTLDLQHGYHQIPVSEDCRKYTAFTTPLGLYEYNVLPFGITTAPAFFQKVISEVFADLIYH